MRSGPVAVVPYDPAWSGHFEDERALLERVLAPWLEGGVHHIGSTAIPGLAAKPREARPTVEVRVRGEDDVAVLRELRGAVAFAVVEMGEVVCYQIE